MTTVFDRNNQLKFHEARSVERQRGIAHLCASGPRVVLEAVLEISSGKPLDSVLRRYTKIPVSTYRMLDAGTLQIHQEFEALLTGRARR